MKRLVPVSAALLALTLLAGSTGLTAAAASEPASPPPVVDRTVVGIHNAYDKSRFPYLVDALESGAGMIELDVWQNFLSSRRYDVGHDAYPSNNCERATRYGQLRRQRRNQSLQSCLDDIRLWHLNRPDHAPLVIKLEMKNGFDNSGGFGPDEFDRLLARRLGRPAIFAPADLLAGRYPDADTASRAGAWPSWEALRGRIIVVLQRGTFESGNPFDRYHTELEYADHLVALARAGRIGEAMMFPTVLGKVQAGDPRTGPHGGARKPWYVSFDSDAVNWVAVDTSFYLAGHYLVTMTAAHAVAPAIPARAPTVEQATARVELLAEAGASVVSADWTSPAVLGLSSERG
jgi:Phosphoinositide phospholipase C, Ca2+-dependent